MTSREFRQAVIPAELAKEVVAVIQAHPELGYRTLSEFVRGATAEKLRLTHLQLATRAIWQTADLGSEAMAALIRDSLPPEYQAHAEGQRSRRGKQYGASPALA